MATTTSLPAQKTAILARIIRRRSWYLPVLVVGLLLGSTATQPSAGLAQVSPTPPTKAADEARYRRAAELAGQALADLEENRCSMATAKFLSLDQLLPNNLLPKINLAICYAMLDQRSQALAWLKQARNLSPNNPQALFATARIVEPLLHNDREARKLWQDSLDRFESTRPRDPRPHYLRASAAQNANAYSEAFQHLRKAVERAPENLALLLAQLTTAAQSGDLEQTEDALNALEDRLNGFDPRAQQYADQLRDGIALGQPEGLRPPALILQNLLRPTDLFRVGLIELLGRGVCTQLFAQLVFDPPLPPSIQGGQDIDVSWVDQTTQWLGTLRDDGQATASQAAAGRDGTSDSLWLTTKAGTFEVTGGPGKPRLSTLAIDSAGLTATDQSLLVDINQDGLADLVTLHGKAVHISLRSPDSEESKFAPPTSVNLPSPGIRMIAGDIDQEGDLDLLVLHPDGSPFYLQNRGSGGLVLTPLKLPSTVTVAVDARIVDLDDDGDLDIVLVGAAGITVLDNLRGGNYRDETANWLPTEGANTRAPASRLEVADFNNDGRFDLVTWGKGQQVVWFNTPQGFEPVSLLRPKSSTWSALTVLDFDNDGDDDIAFAARENPQLGLIRNLRDKEFSHEPFPGLSGINTHGATQLIAADLDDDGDLDIVASGQGPALAFRNDGGSNNHWLRVRLEGLYDNNSKNNIQGHGSKLEVRSGGAYQAKLGDGRVLHFGLGSNRRAEVMRVIWTNGLAQTQQQVSSRQTLVEKQVLKGSCPFLYTWTGDQFEFHTDLMWRSTLGMTFSNGTAAPHQSARDWILIPGDKLVPAAGKYWLNTTAELWETVYLDRQELLVVDHPSDVHLIVDETFRTPPHPTAPPLHWLREERTPRKAVNQLGQSVLSELEHRDEVRVGNLPLTRYQGVTDEHFIDLTFDALPQEATKTLLLWGWIFPTDTSINVALTQDPGLSTAPPHLEIFGEHGWRSLLPSIGLPMGKRKAMVIPLDHLLTKSERRASALRLRVVSTMQIYWNKASLSLGSPNVDAHITRLDPIFADLHYRGFSAELPRKPDAPHIFDYAQVDTRQRFRDLEGNYTAYGQVLEQSLRSDGVFAIMNAGDELSFAYDATHLPSLPDGWVRNFVVFTDGWVKDADLHTKFSQTVLPLPSHQMTSYPDEAISAPAPHRKDSRKVNDAPFTGALLQSPGSSLLP